MEAAFRISTTRGGCYRPRAPPFHTFLHLRLAISSEPRRRPPSSPFSIPRDVPRRSACSSFFYRSLSFVRRRIQARLLFVFYRLLFPISPVRLSYHYSSFVRYLQLLLRSFVRLVASSPLVSPFSLPFPVGSRPKTCFGSLALSDVFYFSSIFALCISPLPRLQLCVSSPRSRVFRMFAGIALDRDASLFTFAFFCPLPPDRRPQGFSYFRSNIGSISPSRLFYGLQPVSRSFCRYVTVPIICHGRIRLSRSWSVEAFAPRLVFA